MRRLWLFGTGLALLCAVALACTDEAKVPAGEGGACELVGDCAEGLACVAQTGQTAGRVCKRLDPAPPAPVDATTPDTSAPDATTPDTSAPDATPDTSAPDATPDTSTPDAADAGSDAAADG